MNALLGHSAQLGWVALKAILLFLTTALGLRLSERRTIAQLSIFDFVVAVATGAISGARQLRPPRPSSPEQWPCWPCSPSTGSWPRCSNAGGSGPARTPTACHLRRRAVARARAQRAGISPREALRILRQAGVGDPNDVRYVLLEPRGAVTVVPHGPLGRANLAALRESGTNDDLPAERPEDHPRTEPE
ncbi:MAG TPA: hypothetical protein VE442_19930 [Jatrophihabitans sp.]|jgi:hypothetical protein|nr:hypothetical protein [Jatrophihabitans sp.]